MMTHHDTAFLALARRLMLPTVCALSVLLLPTGALAQDNDNDGTLPIFGGGTGDTSNGSNGGSNGGGSGDNQTQSGSVATSVPVSTDVQADEIALEEATLQIRAGEGLTLPDFSVAPDDAVYAGHDGEITAVVAAPNGLLIQGRGDLVVPDGMAIDLLPAASYVARIAVLVLDDGSDPLQRVLDGETQPELVHVMGDFGAVDLVGFHAMVANHADSLPGVHATIVLISIDMVGETHISAVRASTDGGPMEVLID